jgi:hypothetical protein
MTVSSLMELWGCGYNHRLIDVCAGFEDYELD